MGVTIVTVHKAKTELSKLIARAVSGEQVTIARGNEPMVTLTPVKGPNESSEKKRRQPGSMKHLARTIPDGIWFEPLPEDELKLWEGGS